MIYTYSYHVFVEEYGLRPNRTNEDAASISFVLRDTSDPEYETSE